MKSIGKLLLTTIVIMLCSCQQPDNSTAKPIDSNVPPIAHRFTFDGHSYIGFKYVRTYGITIIHDPDCKCNKNVTKRIKVMNSKFYVTLEAARLLKEKGYDKECIAYYQNDELHPYAFSRYELSINDKNAAPPYMNQYSAPTKAEAIDWLESKGIVVEIQYNQERNTWSYAIYCICYMSFDEEFNTRLEAEEAAIIKALELL